jgi:hypothetical protein
MAELGYSSRDWYVNWDPCYLTTTYGDDNVYIDSGDEDDEDDIEYPIGRALWHECLFRAFDEMVEDKTYGDEVVTAEQTLRVLNKIIPLVEEVEKCKSPSTPDIPIGP